MIRSKVYVVLCVLYTISVVLCTEYPVRNTTHGPIRGFVSEAIPGQPVEQYLGIPYVKPPVGDLRCEDPQFPDKWQTVLNCTSLPPACPQNPNLRYIQMHLPGFNKEDENCLYINVYTPKNRASLLLPVLFYIHGGSNRVGMGAMMRGDILAGFGDIVVVNFNYRLGALGFYAIKEHDLNGNYGFLDQIMALKWVRDNIATFGGDPTRVTLAGHSAGAANTGLHIVSEMSKGLFHQAMIMSGSPLAFWGIAANDWEPGSNIKKDCIKKLCPMHTEARYNILMKKNSFKKYLKSLPWSDFTNPYNSPQPFRYSEVLTFPVAIVDGVFLNKRPEFTLRHGEYNGNNFAFTFTRDEGAMDVEFVMKHKGTFPVLKAEDYFSILDWYKPIYPNVSTLKELILHEYGGWSRFPNNSDAESVSHRYTEMESDVVFIAPMIKMADILAERTDNITMFTFDYVSATNIKYPEWRRIPHGEDLFYIFGIPLAGWAYDNKLFNQYDNEANKKVSKMMMSLWSNFVKQGKLTTDLSNAVGKYNDQSKRRGYTRLTSKDNYIYIEEGTNYKSRRMAFWNELLPSLSKPTDQDCSRSIAKSNTIVYNANLLLIYIISIFTCLKINLQR